MASGAHGATTFNTMTFSITKNATLSIMAFSIIIDCCYADCHYAEFRCAECLK